jgi:hypothetical protein
MPAVSPGLHVLAILSVAVAGVCALVIIVDEIAGHPQHMWIMNVVWPVTALWSGPVGLLAIYPVGRTSTRQAAMAAKQQGQEPPNRRKPFWQSVGVGAMHCGAGCSLGDLIVEWAVLAVPITLFGSGVFGTRLADYVVAFLLGIAFQYFTIAPMRHLSRKEGLVAALKADTLSLTAWQLGMYGWMALALFVFFSPEALPKTGPAFWLMMQIAMFAGFLTSYPANWWLLRQGIKETM